MAGRHGMPTPEALVATGAWQLVRRHPRWPDSYLLERVA
jgi:hypothetical protein